MITRSERSPKELQHRVNFRIAQGLLRLIISIFICFLAPFVNRVWALQDKDGPCGRGGGGGRKDFGTFQQTSVAFAGCNWYRLMPCSYFLSLI